MADAERFVKKHMTSMDEVIALGAITECQANCRRPVTLVQQLMKQNMAMVQQRQ